VVGRLDCSMILTIQFALLIAFVLVGGTANAVDDTALAWGRCVATGMLR
jgi:hypothetical protein